MQYNKNISVLLHFCFWDFKKLTILIYTISRSLAILIFHFFNITCRYYLQNDRNIVQQSFQNNIKKSVFAIPKMQWGSGFDRTKWLTIDECSRGEVDDESLLPVRKHDVSWSNLAGQQVLVDPRVASFELDGFQFSEVVVGVLLHDGSVERHIGRSLLQVDDDKVAEDEFGRQDFFGQDTTKRSPRVEIEAGRCFDD